MTNTTKSCYFCRLKRANKKSKDIVVDG